MILILHISVRYQYKRSECNDPSI